MEEFTLGHHKVALSQCLQQLKILQEKEHHVCAMSVLIFYLLCSSANLRRNSRRCPCLQSISLILQIQHEQGSGIKGISFATEWYGSQANFPAPIALLVANMHIKQMRLQAAEVAEEFFNGFIFLFNSEFNQNRSC
jgi:hypothetical protein